MVMGVACVEVVVEVEPCPFQLDEVAFEPLAVVADGLGQEQLMMVVLQLLVLVLLPATVVGWHFHSLAYTHTAGWVLHSCIDCRTHVHDVG